MWNTKTNSMLTGLMLRIWLTLGTVIPNGDCEGRQMYIVFDNEGHVVAEYAYYEEVLEYAITETFEYDELMTMALDCE